MQTVNINYLSKKKKKTQRKCKMDVKVQFVIVIDLK